MNHFLPLPEPHGYGILQGCNLRHEGCSPLLIRWLMRRPDGNHKLVCSNCRAVEEARQEGQVAA